MFSPKIYLVTKNAFSERVSYLFDQIVRVIGDKVTRIKVSATDYNDQELLYTNTVMNFTFKRREPLFPRFIQQDKQDTVFFIPPKNATFELQNNKNCALQNPEKPCAYEFIPEVMAVTTSLKEQTSQHKINQETITIN